MSLTTSPARTVWLVRHGSREDVCNPHWLSQSKRRHDPPLASTGVQQARETGIFLARKKINHIFSSPFLRSVETAVQINRQLGLPLKIELGLCEALFTQWFPYPPDFIPTQELARQFAGIDLSYQTAVTPAYPETETQMLSRTARTIQCLLHRHPGNLVLVGHGGAIWGLCQGLVKGNLSLHPTLCCLIKLAGCNHQWIVEKNGTDTSHLSCPEAGPAQPTEERL